MSDCAQSGNEGGAEKGFLLLTQRCFGYRLFCHGSWLFIAEFRYLSYNACLGSPKTSSIFIALQMRRQARNGGENFTSLYLGKRSVGDGVFRGALK